MTTRTLQKPLDRGLFWGGAAVLLLAMLLQLAVNAHLTVYSDDYWYGTFFQDGFKGFLRHSWNHYQNTNGRVYVHLLIPILLLADTKLFALLSPILTALILLLGLRVQTEPGDAPGEPAPGRGACPAVPAGQ